jgi:chromosome segregation ATPase
MELQLLSLAKRENALSTSAAANERKLQALEE